MDQFLTVLWEAGRDKSRNKLVMVRCFRCNKEAIMRKSDIKRNKSCGCLKADTWHAYMVSRKHRKELRPSGNKLWRALQEEHPHAGPTTLCQLAMNEGRYDPFDGRVL